MILQRTKLVLTLSLLTSALHAQAPAASISRAVTGTSESVVKIRVINSAEAMQLTELGKQEAAKIEGLGKELKATLDRKEQSLTQTMNDFKAKSTTLTVAAREKEESRMITMRRDLESTSQASDDQYQHAMKRATEKLSKEIEQAITGIAQAQNIDLVLDLYTGRPVYASERILVTDELIKTMNVSFAKTQKPAVPKAVGQKTTTAQTKTT